MERNLRSVSTMKVILLETGHDQLFEKCISWWNSHNSPQKIEKKPWKLELEERKAVPGEIQCASLGLSKSKSNGIDGTLRRENMIQLGFGIFFIAMVGSKHFWRWVVYVHLRLW